ncbi:MAG: dethiobiotin synthase [Desulfomonile sp.]|nr:dethiobiotin synthase [Desulfomonile sp.]
MNPAGKGIFITGTDTGVGKTLFAAALIRLAAVCGLAVKALKPIETGCPIRSGVLFPEDGAFLVEASEHRVSLDECTPFRFSLPASPYRAAALEGKRIFASDLVEHILSVAETADLAVVEGAGGLMAPIDDNFMMVDLIKRLEFPVILVARTRLGTINHTLLSIEALSRRDIRIEGIVLSQCTPDRGPEEDFTLDDVERNVGDIPVVLLPFVSADYARDPARLAQKLIDAIPGATLHRWLQP